jgi:archaemetzincin
VRRKQPPKSGTHGFIAIKPLGKVNEDVLRVVADTIQGVLRLPVDILEHELIPDEAFMEARNQYNAMAILRHLNANYSDHYLKLLGITRKDLGNPILTHVFGEAYLGGSAAVISYFRMYTGPDGNPVSREVFLDRITKVALHEIGHTFNVPHCHTGRCVMRASNGIADLDDKLNYFCNYCELFLFESVERTLKSMEMEKHKKS